MAAGARVPGGTAEDGEGIAAHYVEPGGANLSEGQANASAGRTSTLRSHSECIVVRSRGLVRNAG